MELGTIGKAQRWERNSVNELGEGEEWMVGWIALFLRGGEISMESDVPFVIAKAHRQVGSLILVKYIDIRKKTEARLRELVPHDQCSGSQQARLTQPSILPCISCLVLRRDSQGKL